MNEHFSVAYALTNNTFAFDFQWLMEAFPQKTIYWTTAASGLACSKHRYLTTFFSLWGYLNEALVYVRRPLIANGDELRQTIIEDVCNDIRGDPDFLDKLSSTSRAI
jgi:hypothetical protein